MSTPDDTIPADETGAQNFLARAGVLNVYSACPSCGDSTVSRIRRDRHRCRHCGYEWGARKGSILEGTRVSFRTFLRLLNCFANDLPASEASRQLGIAYNTTYDLYQKIRSAVLIDDAPGISGTDNGQRGATGSAAAQGSREGAGNAPGGSPAANAGTLLGYGSSPHKEIPGTTKQVVFGIRLADDKVAIAPVNCPEPEIIATLPIPTMQRGNILFIDAYGKTYQGFITYHPARHSSGVVRIRARDGMPWSPLDGFWTFAARTWASRRGLEREQIPVFVQELAFRYNNRDRELLPVLLEKIAASYAG